VDDCARPAQRHKPQPSPHRPSLLSEERLLCHAGVPASALERLRALALRWGVSLRRAASAAGLTTPRAEARALAGMCGLQSAGPGEQLTLRPISPMPEPHRLLNSRAPIPLAGGDAAAVLNAAAYTPDQLADLSLALGPARSRIALTDSPALSRAIARAYGPALADEAANGLAKRRPRFSAAHGIARWQAVFTIGAAGLFLGAAFFTPRDAMAFCSAALSLIFLLTITMRLAAAEQAGVHLLRAGKPPELRPRDYELPNYTVLVAMYREAKVLPELVNALKALNYPPAKLDIKLVLEEDDTETIEAARQLALPPHFEIVIVPDGKPRTKPRALNYALGFASGDLLVIYDAEDRPEPDQLMKAAVHFRRAPREVVCLQARLTFDNASENWLAKQFTIEYASLFVGILPMLDRAKLPLPLGGTSNHFRVGALRAVGAWDAHNVTEDADLGLRLYRCGLRAEMLDSVTYEEACCRVWPWLKQRTRWLKGWIQTYGVHMRQPFRLARELGLRGFLSVQGHFAGVIIAALVHPFSYAIIAHDALAGVLFAPPETALGLNLWLLAIFNLLAGYLASLLLGLFALRGKRLRQLAPHLILIPLYWLLVSAACYRAVYQLVTAPHYWEKTEHGVSRLRRKPRRRGET
jgi:cellulose synthase/poly-beta-1,6-N-acetylglucosamine synthase-like glycosyltransferase